MVACESFTEVTQVSDSRRGLRLNLGCGLFTAEGWENVDKSFGPYLTRHPTVKKTLHQVGLLSSQQYHTHWPSNIRRVDVAKRTPWKPGSVEVIYSSHLLEHLTRSEARTFLQRCLTILRSEGLIRLALPDLKQLVDTYIREKEMHNSGAADMFIENLYLVDEYSHHPPIRRLLLSTLHRDHRWMYDAESLTRLLTELGFVEIKSCNFREGTCPDMDRLEHRLDSFFIEARKP
jgi:predicted SAM-dependent methyltransferase